MNWRKLVRYHSHVNQSAAQMLDTAQQLLLPIDDDDKLHAMSMWLDSLEKNGLIKNSEHIWLMTQLGQHM
jgi:hypothetical protein